MKKQIIFIFLNTLLLPVFSILAQSTLPLNEDIEKKQKKIIIKLNRDNLELAEDYRDLLDQLEKLTFDYQTYYSQYNNFYTKNCKEALSQIIINLDQGSYCIDIDMLSDDLINLEDELHSFEKELKKSSDKPKLYRLTKSLRRELELLDEILDEEIVEPLDKHQESINVIKAYLIRERAKDRTRKKTITQKDLSNKISNIHSTILQKRKGNLTEKQIETLEKLEELNKHLEKIYVVTGTTEPDDIPPTAPPSSSTPPLPEIPQVVVVGKDRTFITKSGQAGMAKEYIDSINIPSKDIPIYINNHTGSLVINGWESDKMVISYDVKVLAENHQTAKSFIDEIEVKLFGSNNNIYLNTHFPSLSDPKRKILSSYMVVNVPLNNKLVCENSFGSIEISDIYKDIKVNSNYCDVFLNKIDGGIKLVNKMGNTRIKNSYDYIDVKSSLGPVYISECYAEIEIENAYASVDVSDCEGSMIIRNSGQISVTDHIGAINIENNNGVVNVKELIGNLIVKNSFKPLYVTSIDGSVTVENMNADILAEDIKGILTAVNRFGIISGKYLNGPIHLTNQRGEISLVLNEGLTGPSSIDADFSVVNLMLSQNSDIFLTAKTNGGIIQSMYPNQIEKYDRISSTEIALGMGKNPLEVSGTDATIIISQPE